VVNETSTSLTKSAIALPRESVANEWYTLYVPNSNKPSIRREKMSLPLHKEDAHKLIDQLSSEATWDDLMQEVYVREAIEQGLEDSKAGKTVDVREVRARYGLTK